ncbi:hypothetical protein F5Y17DRAFT_295710 [Xylariaceae sp. FL0594]|nr:hypothetical protein F5Y17DRAFT_295710 [Xylariaceae sp. FL0594]
MSSDDAPAQPIVAQNADAPVDDSTAPKTVAPVAEAESSKSDKPEPTVADNEVAGADASKAIPEGDRKADSPTTGAAEPSTATDEGVTQGGTNTDNQENTETADTAGPSTNPEKEPADDVTNGPATPAASKSQARRKSTGVADKKKLNRKASKVKILHLDAKPGDHYFAKLKGFPPWPVVICEEDMLPHTMLNSRPVTAARPDGTYREDFADGGKRAADRTFPVMYLSTNEFSWIPNTDLSELDPATVAKLVTPKMRKDLQAAHLLAAEGHDLEYYKNVLQEFEEQRLAKLEAQKTPKAKTPKKSAKVVDEEGDLEMDDIDEDDGEPSEKKAKSKKRKVDDAIKTPQRSESVKKPKIKLTNTSTPKTANGNQSPSVKDSAKSAKPKTKSSKGGKVAATPKEPELTPEERRARKEKEILFLRHRLQRGLLPREGKPVPDEMKQVSDFLAKLETFPDLDVSIIRATKINKVLKAILKLESIPSEDEFRFKPRSQTLLDKWNILLASDTAPAPAATPSTANGINGASDAITKEGNGTSNGPKASSAEEKPAEQQDKEASVKDEAGTNEVETAEA